MYPKNKIAVLLGISAVLLTACGGVTVDSTSKPTSVVKESPTETSKSSATASASATSSASKSSKSDSDSNDHVAAEITERPKTDMERTTKERALLSELKDKGINIDGVEDQLIATADSVCRAKRDNMENPLVDAVSGQLIEQKRISDGTSDVNAISAIIKGAAERGYC